MAACKTCWNCPWKSYQMHLFFVMRATANQKQTTKLQTQERTPKSRFLKVLGYGNYNCFKEIDSCLGLSETKCLGKPVFWGSQNCIQREGELGCKSSWRSPNYSWNPPERCQADCQLLILTVFLTFPISPFSMPFQFLALKILENCV